MQKTDLLWEDFLTLLEEEQFESFTVHSVTFIDSKNDFNLRCTLVKPELLLWPKVVTLVSPEYSTNCDHFWNILIFLFLFLDHIYFKKVYLPKNKTDL